MKYFLVLAAFLLLVEGILADGPYALSWYVIGGGCGYSEGGSYTLDGTIGQPVVGVSRGGPYELCSGFWCGAAVEYRIYLPLVLRNYQLHEC